MNNLSADIAPEATATRTNTGGTDLLEWAGRTSGLDAKVRAAFSGSEDPFGCPLLGDDLGLDETGMQRLFQALANDVEDGSPVFALDSTTTSSIREILTRISVMASTKRVTAWLRTSS